MTTMIRPNKKAEQADAIERLRALLKPGDTVFTILRHVSSSGMSRSISCVIPDAEQGFHDITWLVGRALDYPRRDDGGLKVTGCGMDMSWHLVYNLGWALWPKGFDHTERTHPRNGSKEPRDTDGGYALTARWL